MTKILILSDTGNKVEAKFFWEEGSLSAEETETFRYNSKQELRNRVEAYWTSQRNKALRQEQLNKQSLAGFKWDGNDWSK